VVDTKRNSVYIGTGNNYSVPDDVTQCIVDAEGDGAAQRACLAADNYFDAVVALDLKSGAVRWSTSVIDFDTWNVACLDFPGLPVIPDNCPSAEGPDFDFGQAPMLYTTKVGNKNQDFLGIGQKSGAFWSLYPDTGEIHWSTQVSPGGVAGGMIWGSASDGTRLYTSSANSEFQGWTLLDGSTTNSGIWSALNPLTGEILWQTAAPVPYSAAGGATSVANGVVYACAQNSAGENMFALDAATGEIRWDYASAGACNSGAAIVNGSVYWGYGYASFTGPSVGWGFIAFDLP
jgi:polyvinyl alcohol dehydrogenase (cytochrome)